ncbi:hypothetical protein C0J45_4466 [Silurus meridionalis]|nr:hypothetical protein C0J45_4466 [Silurus meridionalis]
MRSLPGVFVRIDGQRGVYFSESWEPNGSTLYLPVHGTVLANMQKYEQISFEQGCFCIGDETGGFLQRVQGQALHCWRYSKTDTKLFIALSYFFTNRDVEVVRDLKPILGKLEAGQEYILGGTPVQCSLMQTLGQLNIQYTSRRQHLTSVEEEGEKRNCRTLTPSQKSLSFSWIRDGCGLVSRAPGQRAGPVSQAPVERIGLIRILCEVAAVGRTGNGAGASPADGSHL